MASIWKSVFWSIACPQLAENGRPTATPAPAAQQPEARPTKPQQTLEKLKTAWMERKVDLAKLEAKPDGKAINIVVGAGWPPIVIGPTGGINLPTIRSYPKANQAAIEGDKLLARQTERDQKKASAGEKKPATPAQAAPQAKTEVSPAARKKQQHEAIEHRLA
jgi:hypothetical protein